MPCSAFCPVAIATHLAEGEATSPKARLTGEQVFIRAAIASRGAERPYYSSMNTNIANNLASLQ
jgi:hypothetical protein